MIQQKKVYSKIPPRRVPNKGFFPIIVGKICQFFAPKIDLPFFVAVIRDPFSLSRGVVFPIWINPFAVTSCYPAKKLQKVDCTMVLGAPEWHS